MRTSARAMPSARSCIACTKAARSSRIVAEVGLRRKRRLAGTQRLLEAAPGPVELVAVADDVAHEGRAARHQERGGDGRSFRSGQHFPEGDPGRRRRAGTGPCCAGRGAAGPPPRRRIGGHRPGRRRPAVGSQSAASGSPSTPCSGARSKTGSGPPQPDSVSRSCGHRHRAIEVAFELHVGAAVAHEAVRDRQPVALADLVVAAAQAFRSSCGCARGSRRVGARPPARPANRPG